MLTATAADITGFSPTWGYEFAAGAALAARDGALAAVVEGVSPPPAGVDPAVYWADTWAEIARAARDQVAAESRGNFAHLL